MLALLAACGSEARERNVNEDTSAHIDAPVLATTWTTWQEAYVALLWDYASQCPYAAEFPWAADRGWGRHFILHDIDNNGIPELFLMERGKYGDVTNSAVYTFVDGELTPMEFQDIEPWGAIFAPLDGRAFIVDMEEAGMGGFYRRMELDGLTLVITALGDAVTLNEAGREKVNSMLYAENQNWQSYEWFDLAIMTYGWHNCQLITVQEFESIFLRRDERKRLGLLPITEENVERFIFGRE